MSINKNTVPIEYEMLGNGVPTGLAPTNEQEAKSLIRDLDQDERIRESQYLFVDTIGRMEEELNEIDQAERAYFGDAWPQSVRRERDASRLPTTDINEFAPKVDLISGNQRQSRRESRLMSFESDDERKSDLFGLWLKYVNRKNNGWYYDSEMFQNGLIVGRCHKEYYWDFSADPFGELKFIVWPADEILIDPDFTDYNTLDGDAKYRFHIQWIEPRQLARKYKGHDLDWTGIEYVGDRHEHQTRRHLTKDQDDRYDFPSDRKPSLFWKERRWVRLIRLWRYDYKPVFRILDANAPTPEMVHVGDFDTKREAELFFLKMVALGRPIEGFQIIAEQVRYCSYHVFSGRTEIEWQPDIGNFWPWVDFFAIKVNGKVTGLWNRAKDRQQWINYLHSKLLERLGRIGHQPIFIEEGITVDKLNISQALRDGQPIVVREGTLSKGTLPFHIVEDKSLSSIGPLVSLEESHKNDMKSATGAGDVQSGRAPGSVTAASAFALLNEQGAKILQMYTDNIKMTQAINVKLQLLMLYQMYKQRPNLIKMKLRRILGGMLKQEADQGVKEFFEDREVDLDSLLMSLGQMDYDIHESEAAGGAFERAMQLQELQLLRNGFGVMVPPETAIDAMSSLPVHTKDMLKRGVQQVMQNPQMMAALAGQPGGKDGANLNNPMNLENTLTSLTNPGMGG